MGEELSVIVLGKPVGKARPRLGRGHTYTPQATKAYESDVASAWVLKHGNTPLEGALEVDVELYYPLNESDSRKTKQRKLTGEIKATVKPDIDNVLKCILDGLNDIAYKDDKQIVTLTGHKQYSDVPRAVITIREVEND